MNNAFVNRHFATPKPAQEPQKPLEFVANGRRFYIYFMKNNGHFLWIFNHPAPGGNQTIIPERKVCDFLNITERTARAWRRLEKSPDQNAIQLLYLTHTGQIVPPNWARAGFSFTKDRLQRGDVTFTPFDLAEVNQLRWVLKQKTDALKHATSKEGAPPHESDFNNYPGINSERMHNAAKPDNPTRNNANADR